MRREFEARRQKLFEIDPVRATRQVIHFAAIQALEMVMVVQVRFFIERLATRHLHRLYLACLEQRVDGAVNGRLADLGLAFLGERNEVRDSERAVRIHDDVVDDRTLTGLALADFHHAGITVRNADKSAIDIPKGIKRLAIAARFDDRRAKSTLRAVIGMEKTAVELRAQDLEEMKRIAAKLAAEIKPPLLIRVTGNLGAGKTTLIAGILHEWGIPSVTSPTFNLRNDYRLASGRVLHLDFYRLKSGESAADLLPPDEDYSDAVVFVEWPEKANAAIYSQFDRLADLAITTTAEGTRQLTWQTQ